MIVYKGDGSCYTVSGAMVTNGDQCPCVVSGTEAEGLSRARVPISSLRWSLQSPSCSHQQLGGHPGPWTQIFKSEQTGGGGVTLERRCPISMQINIKIVHFSRARKYVK